MKSYIRRKFYSTWNKILNWRVKQLARSLFILCDIASKDEIAYTQRKREKINDLKHRVYKRFLTT